MLVGIYHDEVVYKYDQERNCLKITHLAEILDSDIQGFLQAFKLVISNGFIIVFLTKS